MGLVFDIATSLTFWRKLYPLDRAPRHAAAAMPVDPAFNAGDVWNLAPAWAKRLCEGGEGLHTLSFSQGATRKSRRHASHVWSGPIPEGAFLERNPGVFVESPAFMFLHAANLLEFEQLVAFGDELCGLYSFDACEKRGFRKRREPLTDIQELDRFLRNATGCSGRKAAMRALPYLVERSASPMETYDEMTMCLPYKRGGYCIPAPSMNQVVELTPQAQLVAHRKKCYLDMGYLAYGLDIEHHGKLDHSSVEERESDFERVNGLREMGLEVIELTAETVFDLAAYEVIVKRIARILGKRLDKTKLGPLPERLALRRALKEWNRSSGKVR